MKIAILIPVFNAEKYLRECLDSALAEAQSMCGKGCGNEMLIFCCDDGSTDSSLSILREYALRFGNVSFITQANSGVALARNRLIDELPANVEAFAFLDADDYVKPGMYTTLAEAMERTGADVVECGGVMEGETVVDDMSVYWLRRTSPGAWINVINKLYRRSAVGDVRFREGLSFEEDFFFNREVNAQIRRKVLVPGDFYVYRDNPGSATSVLDQGKYFASTVERVRLTLATFLETGRVPKALEREYRSELAKDAYRMCIRKNLKKNRDPVMRRELFMRAGDAFARLELEHGFRPVGLNPVQRLIYRACRRGNYALARLLVAFT